MGVNFVQISRQNIGTMSSFSPVDPSTTQRSYVASASTYLEPNIQRANLPIPTDAQVAKVCYYSNSFGPSFNPLNVGAVSNTFTSENGSFRSGGPAARDSLSGTCCQYFAPGCRSLHPSRNADGHS